MPIKETDWPIEKLKEWARPALSHPELVEIACTATSNTEAKNRALEFIKEQGLEEKVAMACRWLRILRAKISEEELEGYVASQNRVKQEEKEMKKEKIKVQFSGMLGEVDIEKWSAVKLCNELLSAMAESDAIDELMHFPPHTCAGATERDLMRDLMIQILEEKFGLIVTVCGNCRYYRGGQSSGCGDGLCWAETDKLRNLSWEKLLRGVGADLHGYGGVAKERPAWVNSYSRCIKDWAPKEVSEK